MDTNLGAIISNPRVRAAIYSTYAIIALIATATQVWFSFGEGAVPDWLNRAIAVLVFLVIPMATLSRVNTNTSKYDADGNYSVDR